MRQSTLVVVSVAVLLLSGCSQPASVAKPAAPEAKPELPRCVITWDEARLGDAKLGAALSDWKVAQKGPVQVAKASIANEFHTPAVKGDAVFVVSEHGAAIEAVGVDDTIPGASSVTTTKGLKVGDPSTKVFELYGQPSAGDFRTVSYTDVTTGQPTVKLQVALKQSWSGDMTVQAIEWVVLADRPEKPICQ